MRVLVACEFSGIVRDAFTNRGHYTASCDFLKSEKPGIHYQGDVIKIMDESWDLMIAHPPCTYLTVTGNKWFGHARFPDRYEQRDKAREFFMALINADIPKICVENPVGTMSSYYRKPDQYIQPYEYGHPTSKKTCLWLKDLPKLNPTEIVAPEYKYFKSGARVSSLHFETGKLPFDIRRQKRSITFQGIADAMAEQWG
ncbi:MAG TPA: DNA cytosine methyltransferase [bacterium]|nr:DNA cytosine methyltransferase [bacterium]